MHPRPRQRHTLRNPAGSPRSHLLPAAGRRLLLAASVLLALAMVAPAPARAAGNAGDDGAEWAMFSRVLSLAQGFLSIAAQAPLDDPARANRQMQSHVDGLLSGRNAEANAMAREMFEDMPAGVQSQLLGVARTAIALSQRQQAFDRKQQEARQQAVRPADPLGGGADAAIQARKDLAGMGLSYFNGAQFSEAVRRNDRIAAGLYLRGRGLQPDVLQSARGLTRDPAMLALLSAAD